jgi:S-(hydroxymethyl)glutathione dehydrogenase / alcohol dehydrogenase
MSDQAAAGRTVKAPVFRGVGIPMAMEEITVAPPGPGEVLVKMAASGVCHSCLHSIDGSLEGTPLPIILGDEGAGVVAGTGPGVTGLSPGDHVVLSWAPGCAACRECLRGKPARCLRKPAFGYLPGERTAFTSLNEPVFHYGPATFSPYVVVPASGAIKIRDDVPLSKAALVGCATTTGAGAVLRTAAVQAGQAVAVIGCGGVGLNAVHAAYLAGASQVIAVDPVQIKLDAARQLGASHVIRSAGPDVADAIAAATGGGADAVIVAVGATLAVEQGVAALGPGGKCVVVGAPPTGAMLSIDPNALRAQEKALLGCSYGSCNPPADFPMFIDLYQSGRFALDAIVSRVYRLDELNEAFDNLAQGKDLRGVVVFDETDA